LLLIGGRATGGRSDDAGQSFNDVVVEALLMSPAWELRFFNLPQKVTTVSNDSAANPIRVVRGWSKPHRGWSFYYSNAI